MSSGRTVILLSPQFPPCPLAGVHRARLMAKHLPAFGWRPVVIRAEDEAYPEILDPDLAELVPANVEQIRTKAINYQISKRFGVGDIGLRGYNQFSKAIDEIVKNHEVSVIFITGAPYYPMLLARRVKRKYGIPVVLDFQDPWVSLHGAMQPLCSKAGIAHKLACWLEPLALRAANFVTSVSQIQNDEMATRRPWLNANAMAAIPIGGDPEDFQKIIAGRDYNRASARIELRYIGAYWPKAEPCLRQLFRGLARLKATDPQLAGRLQLHFIGTYSGGVALKEPPRPVLALARQEGVEDLVQESPARVPFVEALRLMATADGLLIIGSDEPHYTASKIYPALMSGRPYLSLFHRASSAHEILSRAGGGCALSFGDAAELETMQTDIAEGLKTLAFRPASLGQADPESYAAYTAHAVAGRFAAIFDKLAAEPPLLRKPSHALSHR